MLANFFVIISCVLVVQASVITLQIDNSKDGSAGLGDCNLRWCDQNCRRIGFPGGVCVRGRCKCDILQSPTLTNSAMDIETNEITSGYNTDVKESVRSCNPSICAAICRMLGFPHSECYGSSCNCYTSKNIGFKIDNSPMTISDAIDVLNLDKNADIDGPKPAVQSCSSPTCNALCIRLGYPKGGVCVGNDCYCLKSKNDIVKVNMNTDADIDGLEPSVKSCSSSTCNALCIRLGYPKGGVCVGNDCYCLKSKNDIVKVNKMPMDDDVVDVLNVDNPAGIDGPKPSVQSCSSPTCDALCIRLGYPKGGVCVGNDCYCLKSKNDIVKVDY